MLPDYDTAIICALAYKYWDQKNLLEKYRFITPTDSFETSYVYGDINAGEIADAVYGVKLNNVLKLEYAYDDLARQYERTLHAGNTSITTSYTYKSLDANSTSCMVDTVTENGYIYSYTYDAVGNITAYTKKNATTNAVVETYVYQYDSKNQLTYAGSDLTSGVSYTYDSNGNILAKKDHSTNTTITYGYTDPTWADLMTSYNGQTITYDEIGNPLQYNNGTAMNFEWIFSRSLYTVTIGDSLINYFYDQSGVRTSKYYGEYYTSYYIVDDVMYGETTYGPDGVTEIIYLFDDNGNKYGFSYNATLYYYQYNLQGDVTGIYDSNGQLVVEYKYDAWGKILSITGPQASAIGQMNPIRYRGYYYDNETGFYYVTSRYYDPEVGRFISADNQIAGVGGEVLGYNMFAYCMNNPVNMSDPSGNWPKWATKLVVAVTVVAVVAVVAVATAGTGTALACIAAGAAKGAAVGFAVGTVNGAASGAISHRISTGSWDGAGEAALNGMADGALSGAITGAITGGMNSNVCFVAGTAVLSSAGFVNIETIRVGDKVWAENPETGQKKLKTVVQTFVNETEHLVHVFVKGEEIITTPKHPFYSPVKGWTAACELHDGDILVSVNGEYVIVEKVQHEILKTPITVYNFEVEDFHTYYVGKDSILVHNVCGTQKALPKNGIKLDSSDALDLADDFLGQGYSEMSPGRFVSSDGLRQVRMTASDLTPINNHAGAPHLNFEKLVPNPLKPGKFQIIENSHVYILD